uniref:Uncharacterized protein n=1 Tax=Arundo donax TaxID=35708 RepID=A0A0A9BCK5_ARUDO
MIEAHFLRVANLQIPYLSKDQEKFYWPRQN